MDSGTTKENLTEIETEKENTEKENVEKENAEAMTYESSENKPEENKPEEDKESICISEAIKEEKNLKLETNKDIFSEYRKSHDADALKRTVRKHLHQTYCSVLLSKDRITILEASRNALSKAYAEKEKKRPKLDVFDTSLDEMWSAYTEYLVAEQALAVEEKLYSMAKSDCLTIKKIFAKLSEI